MEFRDFSVVSDTSSECSSENAVSVQGRNARGWEHMKLLSEDFVPGDHDVLLGRGKQIKESTGNKRFKEIVATKLDAYSVATSRNDKSALIEEVIAEVRRNSRYGGFVKCHPDTGDWYEVGDFLAKEKTAQAFRDALHEYYSSSNPSKKKRRIESIKKSQEKNQAKRTPKVLNNKASVQVQLENLSVGSKTGVFAANPTDSLSRKPHAFLATSMLSAMDMNIMNEGMNPLPGFLEPTPLPSQFVPSASSLTNPMAFRPMVTPPTNFQQLTRSNAAGVPIQQKNYPPMFPDEQSLMDALSSTLDSENADFGLKGDEEQFEPIPLSKIDNEDIIFNFA